MALLWEEMRRSVTYSVWLSKWWTEQAFNRTEASPELQEGFVSFARKQAMNERQLAQKWSDKFAPLQERAITFLSQTYLNAVATLNASNKVMATAADPEWMVRALSGISPAVTAPNIIQVTLEDPLYNENDFD